MRIKQRCLFNETSNDLEQQQELRVWASLWMGTVYGSSFQAFAQSPIKLHSKLKPQLGEKSRENLREWGSCAGFGERTAKERVRGYFCLTLYCSAPSIQVPVGGL